MYTPVVDTFHCMVACQALDVAWHTASVLPKSQFPLPRCLLNHLLLNTSPQVCIRIAVATNTPWMLQHLTDCNSLLNIAVQHQSDQIDALLAHDPRNAQIVVHDLIYGVERVLFVDDGVQQDTESPHILLFATVRATGKNLWRGIVCGMLVLVRVLFCRRSRLTDSAYKDVKRPTLDICRTSKIDQLDVAVAI